MELLSYIDEEFLSRTLFGASVYAWLQVLVVWIIASIVLIFVHRFLKWRLKAVAKRTANQIDDTLAVVVANTRLYFLIALGLYIGVVSTAMPDGVVRVIGKVVILVTLLQVVWWGMHLINFLVARYKERKLEEDAGAVTSMQAIGFLAKVALWSVVLLLALDNMGVDVTTLVAGLGISGVAVALAVQNILGDLFASLSIVLDKPFVVGDFLIMDDYLGTVESIGLKTTRLRSLSGEQLVFSNSDLLKSRIRNYKRMYERRIVFGFGVVYQTPREQVAAIPAMLREIVEAQDQVRFDRAHFKAFGDFSLNFEVVYYVLAPDYNLYMDIQQAINLAIYERFDAEGISFAYPTQQLYVARTASLGHPGGDGQTGEKNATSAG